MRLNPRLQTHQMPHPPPPTHPAPCTPQCTDRFVQNNCLGTLAGIEHAPALASLNVSSNCLPSLAGIEACAELATLTADHNNLEPLSALEPIAACTALQTLDLQHNNISDPGVVGLLRRLPALRCLYLKGNPVVGKVPSYRKALIAALPELTYLDDRPVFEEERRCAEAWCAGGAGAAGGRAGELPALWRPAAGMNAWQSAQHLSVCPLRSLHGYSVLGAALLCQPKNACSHAAGSGPAPSRQAQPTRAGRAAAWRRSARSGRGSRTQRRRRGAAILSGCRS